MNAINPTGIKKKQPKSGMEIMKNFEKGFHRDEVKKNKILWNLYQQLI